jgi:hypothetical protein
MRPAVVATLLVIAIVAAIVALLAVTDGDDDSSQVTDGNNQNGGGSSNAGVAPTPTFVSLLPGTDETVSPAATPPAEVNLVTPPPGFSPAVPLSSESECQIRSSAVVLNWRAAELGRAQVVDLVSDFDDFVPGFYKTSQVLSPNVDSLTWTGLIPGVLYFWRINTRIDGEWVSSQSSQFVTQGCPPVDQA